jgi:hypothetical protein
MKAILASLMLMSASVDKDIKFRPNITIDQQHQITTSGGILNPMEIIRLKTNDYVVIYLPDGTKFSGMITKTEFKTKDHFECFGEIYSHKNAGFGLVLTREGVFAGAIVLRDTDIIYNVTYSKEAEGYVLVKRLTPSVIL